jgi:hypothetical protein
MCRPPVMRIALGVLAYLGFAVLALTGVQWVGRDLREMTDRSPPAVLAIGAAANPGALSAGLLMIVLVDRGSTRSRSGPSDCRSDPRI